MRPYALLAIPVVIWLLAVGQCAPTSLPESEITPTDSAPEGETKLKRVHEPYGPEELKQARYEFNQIDADGDSFITHEELMSLQEVPEDDEREFFMEYDMDQDGKVSFEEILETDARERRKQGLEPITE
eukprot:CAMPEP_0119308702 /NCGR_PEP_ID=MMETSP1333-20130426/12221_1 /TAXON_ID=418940 /ORGANISM="Scyphosphaera apsteinii, Strain RCC1455" /LENGTH=128 /DNA_ID=CAMNT_0007312535 /DNA_START=23 /DNA_END=409 /DNA_ORIENTATION=+